MSLTPENARLAGQLQTQIDQLMNYHDDLRTAVSNNATIQGASVRFNAGGEARVLESSMQMSAADSAALFNALMTIYQNNIDAMQAQLDAITA